MVVLTMISYAMPVLRGRAANGRGAQLLEMSAFWLMSLSMLMITLLLTGAGLVQVWLQRMADEPLPFMAVQAQLSVFYWLRLGFGVIFLIGLLLYIGSFFVKGESRVAAS